MKERLTMARRAKATQAQPAVALASVAEQVAEAVGDGAGVRGAESADDAEPGLPAAG
jgi:hypothetical protein